MCFELSLNILLLSPLMYPFFYNFVPVPRLSQDQMSELTSGDGVVLRNIAIHMEHGFMKVFVSRWGVVCSLPDKVPSTPPVPDVLNIENNMSQIEYQRVS